MDEHNVHHFWGITPALDLGSLLTDSVALAVDQPIRILQVAPYDARHTIATICHATRHPLIQQQPQPVHLTVWEDSPEGLARHLLLLAVVLDGSVLPRERMELLLELHGNVLLRERAASYLDEKARHLETMVVTLASGGARGGTGSGINTSLNKEIDESRGLAALGMMLDLSLLKFQEKDLLVEALQKWRSTVAYDMLKAWDARARKWYGDRYDFRRNLVDWDYHMRLQAAGTPGQDPAYGSIIHFHHFRHWRMHGVAHELRDSHYNQPNRSLLSTAYGKTREFKDRNGRDVGRSVSAWGFWADALNGPYHCFGTLTDEPSFYKVTNKQFARTAVDVAEHNVSALLHELRTGSPLVLAEGSEVPRAKVARGPTSLDDLVQGSPQQQEQQNASESEVDGKDAHQAVAEQPSSQLEGVDGRQQGRMTLDGKAQGKATERDQSTLDSGASAPLAGAAPACDVAGSQIEGTSGGSTLGAVDSGWSSGKRGCDPAPTYHSGGRAAVSQTIAAAAASAATVVAAADDGARVMQAGCNTTPAETPGSVTPGADQAARMQMAAEEAALRAAEAELDNAARTRVQERFRLQLVTGDLTKGVTGRAKFSGAFLAFTVGHRHMHMLAAEHGLFKAAAPGALLVAENVRHVLQLNKEQSALFVTKMDEMATAAGWCKVPQRPPGVTDASEMYRKPAAPA